MIRVTKSVVRNDPLSICANRSRGVGIYIEVVIEF